MAEINTPIEQRVSDLATRVAQEIKTVRGEIVAGGQVTTADKVKLADGTSVQEQIDNILYKKVEITAFSNSVNVVELGSTVDNVTLTWTINKTPTSLTSLSRRRPSPVLVSRPTRPGTSPRRMPATLRPRSPRRSSSLTAVTSAPARSTLMA